MTSPDTTAAVLARVDQAWAEITQTVQALDEAELTETRDPAGWAVKDHLMHVAAWEQAFLASLDGGPRHEALGIDEATDRQGDDDAINAAIFARHRHRPLPEVLEVVRAAHDAARARIAALRDAAILASVPGNTFEHYQQHHLWIRDLVGRIAHPPA